MTKFQLSKLQSTNAMKLTKSSILIRFLTCALIAGSTPLHAQQVTGESGTPAETKAIAEEGFNYGLAIMMN